MQLHRITHSVVTTCTGPKLLHSNTAIPTGVVAMRDRIETIHELLEEEQRFRRIVDYDLQGTNIAVAFKHNKNVVNWHLNEANYQTDLYLALNTNSNTDANANTDANTDTNAMNRLAYFDAPAMIPLQFPSRRSTESFCQYLTDTDDHDEETTEDCVIGIDPYTLNIPIKGNIYVQKSSVGENSGRGVFAAVDLPEIGTVIGLETNIDSVDFPPLTKEVYEDMGDIRVYHNFDDDEPIDTGKDNGKDDGKDNDDGYDDDDDDDEATSPLMACHMHRAVPIYGEAYGYESEVWGAIQTNVMSNLLTFVNHGCNGTANIAPTVPGLNEFTLDPTAENYTIPDAFKSLDPSDADAYNPAHERGVGRSRHTVAVYEPIRRGQELFDNYLEFGGETYFDENILELKSDCSGGAGMVEQAQLVKKQTNRNGRGSKSSKHNTITSTSSSSSIHGETTKTTTTTTSGSGSDEL
mmetsp:Transcript_12756/g.26036  ORF Transcript_12756/g.26036 Transcript_12756/m.26036 type:complete len:465 (-) Transcript_12756:140-1534(-)